MIPIKFLYGLLGLSALYYVINKNYKITNIPKPNDFIICLVVLFIIHYLLHNLNINLNPQKNIEKFMDENFNNGEKCEKTVDGKNVYGCFYENEDKTEGTCYWDLPLEKECPNTREEYLKMIDNEEENKIIESKEKSEEPQKEGDCSIDLLLYLLPKLDDSQVKKILDGSIKNFKFNNEDYNIADIKKCLEDKDSIRTKLINHIVSEEFQNQYTITNEYKNNYKSFKEKCAILQGALNISNNEYTTNLLKDILDNVRCTYDCTDYKNNLNNIEETINTNSTKFKEIDQNYFNSYKTSLEKKCEEEIEQAEELLKENSQKLKKSIRNISEINNLNEINTEDEIVQFNNRSDFIDNARRYVCDRNDEEIQAYRVLGEKVNKLDWWNNSSSSDKK